MPKPVNNYGGNTMKIRTTAMQSAHSVAAARTRANFNVDAGAEYGTAANIGAQTAINAEDQGQAGYTTGATAGNSGS